MAKSLLINWRNVLNISGELIFQLYLAAEQSKQLEGTLLSRSAMLSGEQMSMLYYVFIASKLNGPAIRRSDGIQP